MKINKVTKNLYNTKLYIKRYLAWDMLDFKTSDLERVTETEIQLHINMVSRVISIVVLLTRLLYNFIFSFAMFFLDNFLFTRQFSNVHDSIRILIFLIKILFWCSNREGEKDSNAAFYALGRIFKNKKTRCNYES